MELDIFKNKDIPLYMIDIPYGFNKTHREFFTRIPWGEYKRIRFAERVQSISAHDLKVSIFRDYTVRSPKWNETAIDSLPAGIVDTVADLIMYVSDSGIIPDTQGNIDVLGFVTRLNMYRAISGSNVEYQMYTMICIVFRAYTFEMLDKLPFDRIASLFASAERYLIENGLIKGPLEIIDPAQEVAAPLKKPQKMDEETSMVEEFLKLRRKEKEEYEADQPPVTAEAPKYKKESKQEEAPDNITNALMQKLNANRNNETVYIPPADRTTVANGVQMNVPGIKIDKNNSTGGFDDKDFQGPFMTDDEALAMQLEMGIIPAGYDLVLARKQQVVEQDKKEKAAIPFGKKRFKRK
jgi:hypothetical protein